MGIKLKKQRRKDKQCCKGYGKTMTNYLKNQAVLEKS